jgi:hypothetical protein
MLFTGFFLFCSSFSDKSIALTTAIRIFVMASLFLYIDEASDLINNGRAYAQQAQEICNSPSTIRATSSAGTYEIILNKEPFQVEPERPTMLTLRS